MSFANLPDTLKALPNWVVWKAEAKDGRLTKIPYNAKLGRMAKADDPTTWTTFEVASSAADPLNGSEYDGIGFQLGGSSIVGLDFDNVVDKKGVVDPYVLNILWLLGQPYTEHSPSGKGLHAFVECDALPNGGRKMSQGHDGIEIYHGKEGGRYLTCTGKKILGEGVPKIADISFVFWLITQSRDKKFKALWLGSAADFGDDESKADFHLMLRLAQFTDNNEAKMEKLFSYSGLATRDKWSRDDYRQRTIKAAIESNRTGKIIMPMHLIFRDPPVDDPNGDYVIAPLEGQMDGWFPLGDISLVGGSSGTGKTTLMFDLLHKQKQRFPFLGHNTFGYQFQVLAYDRGQNAFARTMRRLDLLESDVPTTALPLAFGTEAIQNIINEVEKASPMPKVVFIEGMDMLLDDTNTKSVVAPFMRGLQEVAAHFHIALIGSLGAPKTKRGEGYAATRDKLSGSEAWGRNCETVVVLEFAEEDDGTAPGRILTVLPRNAGAEKFEMEFEAGKLVHKPTVPEAETAPAAHLSKPMQVAVDFLQKSLQGDSKPMARLVTDAHNLKNISRKMLYAAADYLHVDTTKIEHGTPVWSLDKLHAGAAQAEEFVDTADIAF